MEKQKYKSYPEEGIPVIEELAKHDFYSNVSLILKMLNAKKISCKSFLYKHYYYNIDIDMRNQYFLIFEKYDKKFKNIHLHCFLYDSKEMIEVSYLFNKKSFKKKFILKNDTLTFNKEILDFINCRLNNLINHCVKDTIRIYS